MSAVGTKRWALIGYTGRFQPFHADHLEMVRTALRLAERVVIGITNPDTSLTQAHKTSAHRHRPDANPFTYEERVTIIAAALTHDGITAGSFVVVPFPLDHSDQWCSLLPPGTPQLVRVFSDWEREKVRRFDEAGYPAIVLEGNAATRIAASDIRRCLASEEPWEHWVPPGARERVAALQARVRNAAAPPMEAEPSC